VAFQHLLPPAWFGGQFWRGKLAEQFVQVETAVFADAQQ